MSGLPKLLWVMSCLLCFQSRSSQSKYHFSQTVPARFHFSFPLGCIPSFLT